MTYKAFGYCLALLLLASPSKAQDGEDVGQDLAERYGIEGWHEVEELDFTFNVVKPNGEQVTRVWRWSPGHGEVWLGAEDDPSARSIDLDVIDEDSRAIHSKFINDSYWLLFPFQLVWSDPTVTPAGLADLPIGDGEARKVICQWPDAGGYTPGDAYDLYLNDAGYIQQWVFRRGGKPGDGFAMTWSEPKQLGPIKVSLEHDNMDGSFRLFFTDVKLKRVGEDGWVSLSNLDE